MSYAVMVSAQLDKDVSRQVIITSHNQKIYSWSRTTNGGRGESNAWKPFNESPLRFADLSEFLLGEPIVIPLTEVDKSAIENNELPNVLIQKLTKQFRNKDNYLNVKDTMRSSIDNFLLLLDSDPTKLGVYHKDGRTNKVTTPTGTKKENQVVTPIATQPKPIIKIVHDNYKENSLSFVPSLSNPELANYVERVFADGITETQIYDLALANRESVAIVGEAGTGKTTSTMAYAGRRGLRYYRVNFNAGVESSQLFGKLLPTEEGKLVWQDGGFTECWRNGHAVIHLDELSFINAKQSGVLFPTLDDTKTLTLLDNKGEVIPMGDNVLIVGSYNDGYRGNNKLNQAFIDRFNHKLVFDYDTNIEKKFIPSTTLLELAKQMRADSIAGIYETPVSTRLLKNFVRFATQLGYNYAVDNFLNNFTPEERSSVKLLLDAHRHNLELELTGKNS